MKEAYDQRRDCFSILLFLFLSFFIPRICKITGRFVISTMAMKMKGIYKGFKCISQIFGCEKERDEIEIGYPTNVKHVAHIGWEGSSGSAPDWMNEFKVGAEVLSPRPSSFSNARPSTSFFTSSSTDFDINSSQRTISDTLRDIPPVTPRNLPKDNNKSRRKKKSSSSSTSPKSSKSSILSKSSYKSTVSRIN